MITANELRIGNWIARGGNSEYYQATPETISDLLGGRIMPKPIPLTEEILLKSGFEKREHPHHIDGIEMIYRVNGKVWFSSCGKLNGGLCVLCLCRGDYFANNIEYLHDLQNLWPFITGTELEINL